MPVTTQVDLSIMVLEHTYIHTYIHTHSSSASGSAPVTTQVDLSIVVLETTALAEYPIAWFGGVRTPATTASMPMQASV